MECYGRLIRKDHTGGRKGCARFGFGEAQVGRTYLCKLARKPELMQPESKIPPCRQQRVHVRRKLRQQPGDLRLHARRLQLVQIVEHEDQAARIVGEVRQHPVDHCLCVEHGRRNQRLVRGVLVERRSDRLE